MKQFEYLTLEYSCSNLCPGPDGPKVRITQEKLDELGNDGWEMVGVYHDGGVTYYHFKRLIV